MVHFRSKGKLLVLFKFTTVAQSRNWDWRQIHRSPSFLSYPTVCWTWWPQLVGSRAEPQPPAILVHLQVKKRKVLITLKSTISLCGGVARKFRLVKMPILRHCFPLFPYDEKKNLAKGGHGRFGQGVNTQIRHCTGCRPRSEAILQHSLGAVTESRSVIRFRS